MSRGLSDVVHCLLKFDKIDKSAFNIISLLTRRVQEQQHFTSKTNFYKNITN